MKALQRPTFSFDTRSVMLFAALSLGGVGVMHAQAQAQTSHPSASFGPASKPAPSPASSPYVVGPAAARPSATASASVAAAFARVDTNKDGQLSAQESQKLPAISQHFKELDTDKSGSLSHTEFEKGAYS